MSSLRPSVLLSIWSDSRIGRILADIGQGKTRETQLALTKIVVLDGFAVDPGDNPWPQLSGERELIVYPRTSRAEIFERGSSADILVTNKTILDAELLEKLQKLKFVSVLATGYNVVDIEAARRKGIPVSNVPSYGTDTVSQYTMALILELCHHVGEHAASVAQGEWGSSADWCYWNSPQIELRDLTLGIVGFGRIGQRVAELGRAFGMRVLYATPSGRPVSSLGKPVDIEALFSESDFVSLHCNYSASNYEFVNMALLSRMKRSAYLINTARGQLVHESDLADALRRGLLTGAALDVLSAEPPKPGNPLLHAPRCLITPHMAWASLAARRRIVRTTAENIEAFLRGAPMNVVNSA